MPVEDDQHANVEIDIELMGAHLDKQVIYLDFKLASIILRFMSTKILKILSSKQLGMHFMSKLKTLKLS